MASSAKSKRLDATFAAETTSTSTEAPQTAAPKVTNGQDSITVKGSGDPDHDR
jgi:hypothetical protein